MTELSSPSDSAASPGNLLLAPLWAGWSLILSLATARAANPSPDNPQTAVTRCELLPASSVPGDVPQSLPRFLVAHCGDPASWIYSDQKCDGTNNCGDCSDELSLGRGLGTGWAEAGGWAAARGQRVTRESLGLPFACLLCILGRSFLPLLEYILWWGTHYHSK